MKLNYINRPVAVIMITIGLVVFGIISLMRLPQSLLPDLSEPTLTVETAFRDASPKEVERLLVTPIEEALGTLSGLRHIESFSQPGKALVKLRFSWNYDMERAVQEIRESLDRLALPDRAERPKILRFDPSFEPVARISFYSASKTQTEIRDIVDNNVKPTLETLKGVATTIIKGGAQDEIVIFFQPGRLESLGVSPKDIISALRNHNVTLPSGKFTQGEKELFVRVRSEFSSIESIKRLVIKQDAGKLLRLSEVAEVVNRQIEPKTITRTDGQMAVFLDVYKEADANIIEVVDGMNLNLSENLSKKKWMQDVSLKVVSDQSLFIRKSVAHVVSAALGGAALAMIILYFFLGELVPALLIGLSIPIAVPVTFFFLEQQGISLNVMSLGGLALGIGMLVDNSIVVLENITRKLSPGGDLVKSVALGTGEMLMPVAASTLTTIAVFAPLAFVEGVAGQLFGDLAWSIIYSLSCSFMVAIVVLPTLFVVIEKILSQKGGIQRGRQISQSLPKTNPAQMPSFATVKSADPSKTAPIWKWLALSGRYFHKIKHQGWSWYMDRRRFAMNGFVKCSLIFPYRVLKCLMLFLFDIGSDVLLFIWIFSFKVLVLLGWFLQLIFRPFRWLSLIFTNYINKIQATSYPAFVSWAFSHKFRVGAFLAILSTIAAVMTINLGGEILPPLSDSRYILDGDVSMGSSIRTTNSTSHAFETVLKGTPGVSNIIALVGIDDAQALVGNSGTNKFRIQFDVDPGMFDLNALRSRFRDFSGTNWELTQPTIGLESQPVEILVIDNDLSRLMLGANRVKSLLSELSFLIPASDTIGTGIPEITVDVNSDILIPLGLSARQIIDEIGNYLRGEEATNVELSDKTLAVKVKALESRFQATQDLDEIKIMLPDKKTVDLKAIAEIGSDIGPAYIYRSSGARAVRLKYQVQSLTLKEALNQLEQTLPKDFLGSSTVIRIEGQTEEYQKSLTSLLAAIALAIFMVYLVMASQFESFIQPLLIMGSIPLAFIGVALVLYPLSMAINVMVLVGCIVLVGIIVNNAIIFVDSVNRLRQTGLETNQAIMETGKKRLRPILMTTATTILGLTPLAFASGEGAALANTMARTIIGGLTFGTFLTLFVIPLLLVICLRDPRSKSNREQVHA